MGRIISYSEKTGYNDGDYLLLDNGEGGTKRIRADRVGIQLDPTLTDPNKAAPANTVKPVDAVPTQGSTNAVRSGGVWEQIEDLKRSVDTDYKRTNSGEFIPNLEVGNIALSGGEISYGTYKYRVRTPEGVKYYLREGDVVSLSDYTNGRFFLLLDSGDGTWTGPGWWSRDHVITTDGYYAVMLANITEDTSAVFSDVSDIGFTVIFKDNSSVYRDVEQLANNLEEAVGFTRILTNDDYSVLSGRVYSYLGKIVEGGYLSIDQNTDVLRIGIQGYADSAYKNKITDSGWITVSGRTVNLNTTLYYRIVVTKNDFSAITDISAINNLIISHHYYIGGKIESITADLVKYMRLQSDTVKSIAHRGDYDTAPQCTAPAYILARKHGFQYAENDINVTSDWKYVMWHDTSLERLGNLVDLSGYEIYTDGTDFYYYDADSNTLYTYSNDEYVTSAVDINTLTRCAGANYSTGTLTFSQVRRIDFGLYKGEEYRGTQILTFAEWVLLCKKLGMQIYIDTKIAYSQSTIAELVGIVRSYGMLNKATWVNIHDTTTLGYIRALDPNARACALLHPTAELVETFADYNTGRGFFFNGNARTITAEDVAIGLNAGFDVECYYVGLTSLTEGRVFDYISTLLEYGVTGITLDGYRVEDAFLSIIAD